MFELYTAPTEGVFQCKSKMNFSYLRTIMREIYTGIHSKFDFIQKDFKIWLCAENPSFEIPLL